VRVMIEAEALAAEIDDAAHAARERTGGPATTVRERETNELARRVDAADGGLQRDERARRHEGLAHVLDDEWHRRETKCEGDLATEAAGRNETELAHAMLRIEEHPLRDAAAVRMTDDVRLFDLELFQPSAEDARMPVEAVRRVGSTRETMAAEIRDENATRARERGHDLRPSLMRIAEAMEKDERRSGPLFDPMEIDAVDTGDLAILGAEAGEHRWVTYAEVGPR